MPNGKLRKGPYVPPFREPLQIEINHHEYDALTYIAGLQLRSTEQQIKWILQRAIEQGIPNFYAGYRPRTKNHAQLTVSPIEELIVQDEGDETS